MIDAHAFSEVWIRLCRRFGRDMQTDEAASYRAYLDDVGMTTDAFLAAAGQLWATREFFPRPADFLLVRIAQDWRWLQLVLDAYNPPGGQWNAELWDGLSIRGQEAVRFLGGLRAVKDQAQRDPARLFERFRDAYHLVVVEQSAKTRALPADTHAAPMPECKERRRLTGAEK